MYMYRWRKVCGGGTRLRRGLEEVGAGDHHPLLSLEPWLAALTSVCGLASSNLVNVVLFSSLSLPPSLPPSLPLSPSLSISLSLSLSLPAVTASENIRPSRLEEDLVLLFVHNQLGAFIAAVIRSSTTNKK